MPRRSKLKVQRVIVAEVHNHGGHMGRRRRVTLTETQKEKMDGLLDDKPVHIGSKQRSLDGDCWAVKHRGKLWWQPHGDDALSGKVHWEFVGDGTSVDIKIASAMQ